MIQNFLKRELLPIAFRNKLFGKGLDLLGNEFLDDLFFSQRVELLWMRELVQSNSVASKAENKNFIEAILLRSPRAITVTLFI